MRRLLLLLLLSALASGEDTLESKVAETDFTNAEQIFALATWCKEHRLQTTAQKYYSQVLRVDKDHEGARTALGYVRVGDRWVAKAYAPAHQAQANGDADHGSLPHLAAAPGPTAAQIQWNLTPPEDPSPTNAFISKYVDRLPNVDNESEDMDISVATCIDARYWPSACPRLCKALLSDSFNDLYGASMMVLELAKRNRLAEASPLIGFMVKASSHITDANDLEAFCWALPAFKDRRCVPRLIELMEQDNASLAKAATQAVAAIAHLRATDLDVAKAHAWWNENWSVSESEALRNALNSPDEGQALEAARALYDARDKAMIPTAIRCLHSGDALIRRGGIDLIARITGDAWGFDPVGPDESRAKVIAHIESWWKDGKDTFAFRDAAGAGAAAGDPIAEAVSNLDRTEGTIAQQAEATLVARGRAAVPALINGLASPGVIIRRRCSELLKRITKQDIAFDARDSEDNRQKAQAQWQEWWTAHAADAPGSTPDH